jgi:hypothetical protein
MNVTIPQPQLLQPAVHLASRGWNSEDIWEWRAPGQIVTPMTNVHRLYDLSFLLLLRRFGSPRPHWFRTTQHQELDESSTAMKATRRARRTIPNKFKCRDSTEMWQNTACRMRSRALTADTSRGCSIQYSRCLYMHSLMQGLHAVGWIGWMGLRVQSLLVYDAWLRLIGPNLMLSMLHVSDRIVRVFS